MGARFNAQASAGIGGRQGTSATPPRPSAAVQGATYDPATKRALQIAAGLFVVLVFLHTKGK